ncbi:MAG: tetratricopeptide repeat protein [Desulfocapsaceae bacterium]|nr:tetratricopeptide repeat protein [Desulfocapsaceae bacterium]
MVKDLGRTVEYTVKGDYFLQSDQSDRGRRSFEREVELNPDSTLANYYYGRFLLQENENREALVYLRKARDLDPTNADYHFWAGLAAGANGMIKEEEKSYRSALEIDANHLQSLIYLGHRLLAGKRYEKALDLYMQALAIWPGSPSALYNRALILNKLGRTPEEIIAWLDYLEQYPTGSMARQATDYLNGARNFSFRNHTLGTHTITLEKIRFVPFSAELADASHNSLLLVGEVFADMQQGTLQIITYQKNNKELAQRRVIAIKDYLLAEFPSIPRTRIGISWFAEPQRIMISGKKLSIEESVSFFVTVK